MKRCREVAVGLVLLGLAAAPAAAQISPSFFLGGGVTIPTGDFGDVADTGWMATGGLTFDVGTGPLWLGVEGLYGMNGVKDFDDADYKLYGGSALIGAGFGEEEATVSPYVYASLGLLAAKVDSDLGESDTESEFSWGLAGGLNFALGGLDLWAEARYMTAGDLKFIPIFIGVTLGAN